MIGTVIAALLGVVGTVVMGLLIRSLIRRGEGLTVMNLVILDVNIMGIINNVIILVSKGFL